MKRGAVLTVSLCVSLTQLALFPASAALSDRIGRIRIYALGATATSMAVSAYIVGLAVIALVSIRILAGRAAHER